MRAPPFAAPPQLPVCAQVKKSVREGPPGTFRATFEDRILMSDIVFCRTWVPVAPARFYNPITSLLDDPTAEIATAAPPKPRAKGADAHKRPRLSDDAGDGRRGGGKGAAEGDREEGEEEGAPAPPPGDGLLLMRTAKQLRAAAGVGLPAAPDSLYKPIEREERKFNPLHVPRSLQVRCGDGGGGGEL